MRKGLLQPLKSKQARGGFRTGSRDGGESTIGSGEGEGSSALAEAAFCQSQGLELEKPTS